MGGTVPLRILLIFIVFIMLRGLLLCRGMAFEVLKYTTKTCSSLWLYAQVSICRSISKKNTVMVAMCYAQGIHSCMMYADQGKCSRTVFVSSVQQVGV